jgi:hypothetical protein
MDDAFKKDSETMKTAFACLASSLRCIAAFLARPNDPTAMQEDDCRSYFRTEIQYDTISHCLLNSAVLETDYAPRVVNAIFQMIKGPQWKPSDHGAALIDNPEALKVLLDILPKLSTDLAIESLQSVRVIFQLSESSVGANLLVNAGIIRYMLVEHSDDLFGTASPLRTELVGLLTEICSTFVSRNEFKQLASVLLRPAVIDLTRKARNSKVSLPVLPVPWAAIDRDNDAHWENVRILCELSRNLSSVPYIGMGCRVPWTDVARLDDEDTRSSVNFLEIESVRSLHPTTFPNQFVFSLWMQYDASMILDKRPERYDIALHIPLMYMVDRESGSHLYAYLDCRTSNMIVQSKSRRNTETIRIRIPFFDKDWHHLAIMIQRPKRILSNTECIILFVDGEHLGTEKLSLELFTIGGTQVSVGFPVFEVPSRWILYKV